MNQPQRTLVIFDLDHTLVHLDTFADFARSLLSRDWWRAAAALVALPLAAPLALFSRTRPAALSTFVWLGTVGVDAAALERLMDAYVAQRFAGGRFMCVRAVQELREYLAGGARVVIATGCEFRLAARLCSAMGVADVEVVGSSLRSWRGGWIAARHCYGSRKLAMLREQLVREQWDGVYTDSAADLPVLREALRRVVANPRPAALRKIAAAIGEDFEIIDCSALNCREG